MELISIIVPVYNVEKYLRQCLDSVLAQTYSNIEVIMVDDGSPDRSGIICDEYAAKYSNFKAVHKKNAGLGMARNTGLEHITGEYVMFLDSDDYIDRELIQELYDAVKKYHIDVCRCGNRDVSVDGKTISETVYALEIFEGGDAAAVLLPRLIGSAPDKKDVLGVSACTSIYKVSVIREHNIQFHSEREFISEDMIFNIDYMQHADGGGVIPVAGYNYRKNEASLTKSYRPDKYREIIKLHQYIKQRLSELTDDPETLYRADRMLFIGIRGCINQERRRISGNTYVKAVKNIKKICNEVYIQTVLKIYPVRCLGFKQQLFVYMLRYRLNALLLLCAELGLG